MSLTAEELGTKLIAEVEECRLDQVLHEVQTLYERQQYHVEKSRPTATSATSSEGQSTAVNAESYPYLGIPILDALLVSTSASAASHHTHQQHRETDGHRIRPMMVEVTQPTSSGGDLHLLYAAIAAAVFPSTASPPQPSSTTSEDTTGRGISKGGKAGIAIVFDTEGTFDIMHLTRAMLSLLPQATPPSASLPATTTPTEEPNTNPIELHQSTIEQALAHVHIFRPTSLLQLVETMAHLPQYLHTLNDTSSAGHASYERALALIAIDSISSFYWSDRHARASNDADSESRAPVQPDAAPTAQQTAWSDLARALRRLQSMFPQATVLATAWPIAPVNMALLERTPLRAAFTTHLPDAWSSLVTARLVVEREPVCRFPTGMSLAQCMNEQREGRRKVVGDGRFNVWRVGEQRLRRAVFQVDEEGVHF